jgi:hypothetical protein
MLRVLREAWKKVTSRRKGTTRLGVSVALGTVEFGGEYHSHLLGDALFTQKV